MSVLLFTVIVLVGAFLAGLVGSLTGLGGGVIIIPLLTLALGVDIHYAIGASIVSVIATSSGSAAAYVKEGITNIRIGMFLEIATTISAIFGAVITVYINPGYIAVIFGLILLFSAVMMVRKKVDHSDDDASGRLAVFFKLNGSYPVEGGLKKYGVHNVIGGFVMMFFAGIISGLLGIGSGALKVLAMDNIMRIPFKVSTTTSNFMMGVTAAASAVVYLHRGQIVPGIAMPVTIGVLLGATLGSKILVKTKTDKLKVIFAAVVGKHFFADKDVQVILGTLLRVGVVLSMSIVLIGGFIYLWHFGNGLVNYRVFDPLKAEYSSVLAIFRGLKSLDSTAIIQFGVLLLIFTPITRVVFSIFSFLIEKDYMYVLIGIFVLCVILFSLSNKLVG
eukprot:gene3242-3696_t